MDELITDALRFARGTSEVAQEVELKPFVEDVVASFEQSIPLSMDGEDVRVSVAPGALERVLMNLITNALQHGKDVRVHIVGREVHVIDRGPGIPAEHREEVFQPFFRLDDSRSVATGGSGLGLAIVQQLCQAQGWRVEIQDTEIGETDVFVTL